MPILAPADWLILVLDLFFVLAVILAVRPYIHTAGDYLEAGRSLPGWLSALAFAAIVFGALAPFALGAAGAHHGFAGVAFFALGAVPPMIFAGLVLVPRYYASGARTLPEYLALRFDEKTRLLAATVFVLASITGVAAAFFAVIRVLKAMGVFELVTRSIGLPAGWDFVLILAFPAAVVLATLLLGGLRGVLAVIVLQFFVLTAGLAPVAVLGVIKAGGWSGLRSAASATMPLWNWGGGAATGFSGLLTAFLMGVVSFAAIGSDFSVLQTVFAASNARAARRAPLIAAVLVLAVSVVLILPGMAAIALPTPHTTTVEHEENGAIYHEITVVPPAAEAGRGVVPAVTDPATNRPLRGADGSSLLDYTKATPSLMADVLPMGLLGLGVAALLASLITGATAGIAAASAVFTRDLYQAHLRKAADSRHLLAVARWSAVTVTLLAVAAACFALRPGAGMSDPLGWLAVLLGRLSVPLFATVLAAIFLKRATGTGAFAGLAAGMVVSTLPTWFPAIPALRAAWPAWIGPQHGGLAMSFCATIAVFAANLAVTAAVSRPAQAEPQTSPTAIALSPQADASPTRVLVDLRLPMGIMFAMGGAILASLGMATKQNADLYTICRGIDANLWWGIVLLLFGIVMVQLGRRGQMRIDKGKQ